MREGQPREGEGWAVPKSLKVSSAKSTSWAELSQNPRSKAGWALLPLRGPAPAFTGPGGSPSVGGNSFSEHHSQVPALLVSHPLRSPDAWFISQKPPLKLASGIFLHRNAPCLETHMQMHRLLLYTPFTPFPPYLYPLGILLYCSFLFKAS